MNIQGLAFLKLNFEILMVFCRPASLSGIRLIEIAFDKFPKRKLNRYPGFWFQ